MPIINRIHQTIEKIKSKILGDISKQEISAKKKELENKFNETDVSEMDTNMKQKYTTFFRKLTDVDDSLTLTNVQILLMSNILTYVREIMKIQQSATKRIKDKNTTDEMVCIVIYINNLDIFFFFLKIQIPLNKLLNNIFNSNQNRNLADQQVQDLNRELDRIQCIITFVQIQEELSSGTIRREIKTDDANELSKLQHLITKCGPFTNTDKKMFDEHVEAWKKVLSLPGLGITETERVEIVQALNLSKGHWYTCPKGHPYIITEVKNR